MSNGTIVVGGIIDQLESIVTFDVDMRAGATRTRGGVSRSRYEVGVAPRRRNNPDMFINWRTFESPLSRGRYVELFAFESVGHCIRT